MKYKKILSGIVSAAIVSSVFSCMPSYSDSPSELIDSGIDYTESTETIDNPGAGYSSTVWMSCKPNNTPVFNPTGNLTLLLVDIGGFSSGSNGTTDDDGNYTEGKDYDLDDTFFANLRKTLDNCRNNGCTVAMRFRYDANGKLNPEPATYDKMAEHIEQIRKDGLLEDYKDIIAFVETGFVGSWGEHWGGKYCSFEDKARLVDIMLEAVPEEIPITVRTPMTFVTWAGIEESELGEYVSEKGSDAARIGLYNDGYMGSNSDLGTYHDRERDLKWLNRQSLNTYYGGEFSGNIEFAKQYDTYLPENAVPEMYYTHLSYINSNIYELYKDYTFSEKYDVENADNSAYYGETVFKFIRDHIGYRFVLRDCDLSKSVPQGDTLTIDADIENTGFSNPHIAQKAEILLEKDGNYIRTNADIDAREWLSCTTVSPKFEMKIPGGLETGEWNVYFKLSYGNNTQAEMAVRSVKFANKNTWNPALGANYLGSFTVTKSTDSKKLTDSSFYQINAENPVSHSDGEMYTVNNIACTDGYAGNAFERSDEIRYAENDGNSLYITNDDKYLYVMAEITHNAKSPVYNLAIDNQSDNKNYWLYYQGNGFIYFNNGTPYGCLQKHNGSVVEFRIPLDELMGLEPKTILSKVRVFIQDEADSWKCVGDISSGEYVVTDNFNIYSAKRTVYLNENDNITLTARSSGSNLSYQWFFNDMPISNANSQSFSVSGASIDNAGLYSVKITSADGTEKTVDICDVAGIVKNNLGDVNSDGSFSAADIVMMQKWLLNSGEITDWKNGDMDGNNTLDIFDLYIMKHQLLSEE